MCIYIYNIFIQYYTVDSKLVEKCNKNCNDSMKLNVTKVWECVTTYDPVVSSYQLR